MGRRPPSFEDSSDAQDKRTRANRGYIFRSTRLPADELNGFTIADRLDDSVASARDTEQVEGRTIRKGVRWHEAHRPQNRERNAPNLANDREPRSPSERIGQFIN